MKNESGFSFLESLVSIGMVMFLCLTVVPVTVLSILQTEAASVKYELWAVAAEKAEYVKYTGVRPSEVIKKGVTYRVIYSQEGICVYHASDSQLYICTSEES
ncbi:type II secretion system protein [Jeotgalibacillus sp. R-1-5s-1]|uniref:type II secretion system protein n=1 Tax=Jeotgalibacillus sp. R-1-5s-1 TaxID=2555897 RepID=UPI00106D48CF|nr:type II secretion system protein [Jeotgalibacillus sp. R-1-5s-1]TFD92275.1 type II secretion system protein [Jeotgalibacillus sp. R-1-5s-1]